jgi:hypothetical protein
MKGQKVKKIIEDELESGFYEILWESTNKDNNLVASGVYIYALRVNGKFAGARKCLLLK